MYEEKQPKIVMKIQQKIESVEELKHIFYSYLTSQNYTPTQIERLLLKNRNYITSKFIYDFYTTYPDLSQQYRYLLLATVLSFENPEQYSQRWNTFYQIMNEILKLPLEDRTLIEGYAINFLKFIIDRNVQFLKNFPSSLQIIQQYQTLKSLKVVNLKAHNMARIFNSILCFSSISLSEILYFISVIKLEDKNQFLQDITPKLCKKLPQMINSFSNDHIKELLTVFFNIYGIELVRDELATLKVLLKTTQFQDILILMTKVLLTNTKIQDRQFLLELIFSAIKKTNDEVYRLILEAQEEETNEDIVKVLYDKITIESLSYITVSRVKSMLKRLSFKKQLKQISSIEKNPEKKYEKILRGIHLIQISGKKHSTGTQMFIFRADSALELKNTNISTLIFSVDLISAQPKQNNTKSQIQIKLNNSILYRISINRINENNIQQTLHTPMLTRTEKKTYNPYLPMMCLISINKTHINFLIDGILYELEDKEGFKNKTEIVRVKFSGAGIVRDIVGFDASTNVVEAEKAWIEGYKKITSLISFIGQKHVMVNLNEGKIESKKNWFWNKQIEVIEKGVEKPKSVSFGQAIQQLGGLPSVFFLFEKAIPYRDDPQIIKILEQLFILLKIILVEGEKTLTQKWIKESSLYLSQFLWLLLNRNKYIPESCTLFNRIFDFVAWFIALEPLVEFDIINHLYLNFQLWNKCCFSVSLMALSHMEKAMEHNRLIARMVENNSYEILLSSIIFFFQDINEKDKFIIKQKIVNLANKLSFSYDSDIKYLQRDLNTCISLLSSQFYKKKLYFSEHEKQSLLLLIQHFQDNFLRPSILSRISEIWIYVMYHLVKLIEISPLHSEILTELTTLAITVIERTSNLKNTIPMLGKSLLTREDEPELRIKYMMRIISANYQFEEGEQIFDGILQDTLKKVQKNTNSENILQQFKKMNDPGFVKVLSFTPFRQILKKCELQTLSEVLWHLFKRIIHNKLLPSCTATLQLCFSLLPSQQNKKIVENLQFLDFSYVMQYCRSIEILKILKKLNLLRSEPLMKWPWKRSQNEGRRFGGELGWILINDSILEEQVNFFFEFYVENYQEQSSIFENLSMALLPFFLSYRSLMILVNLYKKPPEHEKYKESCQILNASLKQAKIIQQTINFAQITKPFLKKIEDIQRRYSRINNGKVQELQNVSLAMFQSYRQAKITGEICNILKQLSKSDVLEYVNKNIKVLKRVLDQLKQILSFYRLLFNAYQINKFPIGQENQSSIVSQRKTQKKQLIISDRQFYEPYCQQLKKKIIRITKKLRDFAQYREKKWKQLAQTNKFWSSTKIKNNQCYQIDEKITGCYRLNIVKKQFEEVPYPRRKSYEIEEQVSELSYRSMHQDNLNSLTFFVPEQEPEIEERKKVENEYIDKTSKFFFCEYVTQKGIYAGKLFLVTIPPKRQYSDPESYLLFKCTGYDSLPDEKVFKFSTRFHRVEDLQFRQRIFLNKDNELFSRRYILRHTAIELFSCWKAYFFNLFDETNVNTFFNFMKDHVQCIKDLRGEFKKKGFTEKWLTGAMDNFQYLMSINKYSGRTYNDLGQYPVMPWVITNYEDKVCDVNSSFVQNQANLRDLSKPSGKLSKQKFQKLLIRCNEIPKENYEIRFLYGTMYSNPTVIYSNFIRLQPFTSLHWDHQGRRIDHADRLFSSIKELFRTVLTSSSDNKQLTPQFYYWPQFLRNRNQVDLGIKQNQEEVHDVRLPGWSQTPEQFIFKMREVLESPQVTKSIHYWIDLIFGYKNPYEVAEQHDNLFHFRTYEHDIFETETTDHEIESAQITISEFGQIPYPLFTSQHPAKKQRGIIALDNHIVIKKKSDKTIKEFVVDKRGIFLASDGDVEFLMSNLDTVETVSGKVYADGEKGPTKLISFSENLWARLCDGTLSIWKKKVCINRTKLQADVFSTMYQYIIYNYKSELRISKFEQTGQLKLIKCLYGHLNLIKIIEVNQTLDLIVSVDTDGLVLVHEFYTGKLQRQFQIGTTKVCQVCIHQMGYFIFFTTEQRIIVYTFLGEVLLDQYINLPVRPHHPEKIITIAIFSQNQSQLLLGTSLNNIFMINFLILRRFSICYPYKTFSRIKNNILKNCVQFSKGSGFFQIQPIIVPGQPPTHKIYVLNGDGTFGCFYQSQLLGKRLKETKTLGALGLFSKQ